MSSPRPFCIGGILFFDVIVSAISVELSDDSFVKPSDDASLGSFGDSLSKPVLLETGSKVFEFGIISELGRSSCPPLIDEVWIFSVSLSSEVFFLSIVVRFPSIVFF